MSSCGFCKNNGQFVPYLMKEDRRVRINMLVCSKHRMGTLEFQMKTGKELPKGVKVVYARIKDPK